MFSRRQIQLIFFLKKNAFFSRSYIYVQLFHLNCIEKDLYIAIKVKLQERFKVI